MKYDRNKALHSLLYLCNHLPKPVDVYTALKVIYFADKLHLERFGRLMFGETYIAMDNGPVPSGTYDIVKYVSGRATWDLKFPEANASLYATKTELIPKGEADLDVFSRSELQCLILSARQNGALDFQGLKVKSHDAAWHAASANGEIDIEEIARTLRDGDVVVKHLRERMPGEEIAPQPPDQVSRSLGEPSMPSPHESMA